MTRAGKFYSLNPSSSLDDENVPCTEEHLGVACFRVGNSRWLIGYLGCRDREGFWRDKTDVGIEPGLEELFWEKGYEREWEKTDERAERDKKRKMYCFVQWKENKRVNELALLYNIRLRKIILYLMVDKTKSLS